MGTKSGSPIEYFASLLIPDSLPAQYETNPLGKTWLLQDKFFPSPPEAVLSDISNYEYFSPIVAHPITIIKVHQAIMRLTPFNAPGPTLIPNIVL